MRAGQRTVQSWFHEVATHYVEAQVLFHLNQVGVWGELRARGPRTAEALATALGLDARLLEVLLDFASGVDDLLTRDEAGRYALSEFGQAVLTRFGRKDADGEEVYNFFDVRVGAYGPVWAALGPMLKGEVRYGRDLHRAGGYAAEATYTITPRMAPTVSRLVAEHERRCLVEIGVPTGMLAHLAPELPGVALVGLDVDEGALARARARAIDNGVPDIHWVRGDLFEPAAWADQLSRVDSGAFVTVHLHELSARGLDRTRDMLAALSGRFPGWLWIALEQDRLPAAARDAISRDLWLYAQSNVLIHHLIRNANVCTRQEWLSLYEGAGVTVLSVEELGYLGYSAYVARL